MCFYFQQSKDATNLKNRFKAKYSDDKISPMGSFNGFTYPKTPVITNEKIDEIELLNWGLIPNWSKDEEIRKFTLNARVETIKEKPSFRNSVNKRCLIIADTFFEWQWLDPKGKQKQKYEIFIENKDSFVFGGLWSRWTNKETGEIKDTYTILTCEANKLMSEIHNSKKRMPLIIANEFEWLNGEDPILRNDNLIAEAI